MNSSPPATSSIERLVSLLDSMVNGERAVEQIIAIGRPAVPYLERFLLSSPPRSLSLPRCRAARALGELGACSALIEYFQRYTRPDDAVVLFAEDAVRSAAAEELLHCQGEGAFPVLLNAVRDRATGGLVRSLGELRRPEAIPAFFELLEDDLCREDAKEALRKCAKPALSFAVLLLRGRTEVPIIGPAASRRRRATLQLLAEWGVSVAEWPELRRFLWDEDIECVIAAARVGMRLSGSDKEEIVAALIENSASMNWAQETDAVELLDSCGVIARVVALKIAERRKNLGERPAWASPFWRTLHHLLGGELYTRLGETT
jgi:HEAT repeat protein